MADVVDASTGQLLKGNHVEGARQEEMVYFEKKDVYTTVPLQEAYDRTGKVPVGVRWVDVSNGDDIVLNYRSRLVAKDIRRKVERQSSRQRLPWSHSERG